MKHFPDRALHFIRATCINKHFPQDIIVGNNGQRTEQTRVSEWVEYKERQGTNVGTSELGRERVGESPNLEQFGKIMNR